jgi:dimethylglycine dehydrogenase
LSLRLEKSFGIWSAEFTQDRTPRMTGMDRWIAWDKGDFLGRKAALVDSKDAPERQLITLEIDALDADATGYEPVWRSGAIVGFVTSGGYGHTIGKSLAMALVASEAAEIGSELSVHIVGAERKARVIAPSPYDPLGKAMRA